MGILIAIITIAVGLFFGLRADKQHFKYLTEQEAAMSDMLLTSVKRMPGLETARGQLVTGSVVIANDAFKKFISSFMMFFGGRVSVYETLMERARREAIVRMQQEAKTLGAHQIINIRVETATIKGKTPKSIGSIEMLAYGTAITHA